MHAVNPIPIQKSVAGAFWRFAIPSIVAMLVNGLYQIIDGFLLAIFVGSEGLAGINMAHSVTGSHYGVRYADRYGRRQPVVQISGRK